MGYSKNRIEELLAEIDTLKKENSALKTMYNSNLVNESVPSESISQIGNEEEYKSLFNNSHIIMLLIDPSSGNIVDANNAACKFYGWDYDKMRMMNISEINNLPHSEVKDVMGKIKNKNQNHFQFNHTIANGDIKKVEVHSGHVKIGNKNFIYSIIHDITARASFESALKQSEEQFRQLVWSMQVGVILQGSKSEIILCNPKSLELLGITEDQLLGKTSFDPDWNVIHEDGSPFPGNTHPVPQAIDSGKPVLNVVMGVYRPSNADRVWLLVDAIPLYNSDLTVRQVICTFINITSRKKAVEALEESEDRLARAEKVAKIGNWKLLLDSKQIVSSSGARIIYGVDRDNLSLEDIRKIPLPEYRQMLDEALGNLITKNIPYNVEYKIRRPNDYKITEIHSIADYDKENNIIFGVVHDITEQNKIESDLRKKTEELDNYFTNALDLFCIANAEGYFLKLNKEWENTLGYSLAELEEKKFLDFVHPEDIQATLNVLLMLSENKPILNFINRYQAKNGSYRIIEWRSKTEGNLIYAAARDITERKLAEEALKDSELFVKGILNSLTAQLAVLDEDGIILSVNQAWKNFAVENNSPDPSYYLGVNYFNVFKAILLTNDITAESILMGMRSVLDGSQDQFTTEYPCHTLTKQLWFSITVLPQTKPHKGLIVVQQDITESKKAEEEIKEKNRELIKINSEKDRFFSIIAHDLRSPFEGLLHLSEYMANESQDFTISEFARVSKSLNNSAVNVYKLLNNLLEWALIQQGKMTLDLQQLNLFDNLVLNIDIVTERASQKNITVSNYVDANIFVLADEKMLNSIIRNLLSNAIKFTSVNGNVSVSAKEIENNMIEISVSDNGIGMPDDLCKKLFKIEEQVGRTGTEGEHSSGLGLVLCKEFVKKLGGSIWAKSQENIGSAFYFTLPILFDK